MSAPQILIVEDEVDIAMSLADRLQAEGFRVTCVADGLEAVEVARSRRPDLVVLDLMLPGLDGIEVCRRIQADVRTPVVMLTARDDETDVLVGLGVGADDYVTKPFSPRLLVARIKAVLRRADEVAGNGAAIAVADFTCDRAARRVTRAGDEVHLTPTEFDLVAHLASRPDRVYTREELLIEVWGYADGSGARTVDSHVRAVRRKLGDDTIRTAHGVGYAFGLK